MPPSEGDFSYADDEELVEQFVSWTSDAVSELREIAAELTGAEQKTDSKAERIYDLTHNIKGMGSSFNFPIMTNAGSSLCNYIKGLNDGVPMSNKVVEAHVRVFEVVLQHKIQGDGGEKGKALQSRLSSIIDAES